MVVLKLVVWLILEQDYARHGEKATGRKFLELVKDPDHTLVGQFVNHFKSRYKKDALEEIQIKYIKEAEDDADIDPDWTISDAFIDHGRAETDNSDQRATIKLIRKTVEGIPARAGSVVPDLSLPQFQHPIPTQASVRATNIRQPAAVLGKRSSQTAFGGDDLRLTTLSHIPEEDRPISSIEREYRDGSTEIPASSGQTALVRQFEKPNSGFEEEEQVPSTYASVAGQEIAPTSPISSSIQALSQPLSTRDDLNTRHGRIHDTSRPPSMLQIVPPPHDEHETGLTSHKLMDLNPGTSISPVETRKELPTLHVSKRRGATQTTPATTSQARFVSGEGKLSRPRKSHNSPVTFTKTINQQQAKKRLDTFDVPDSEIEDSQQEPKVVAPPAKRRKVSKTNSPNASKSKRNSREVDSLLSSNAAILEAGTKRVKQTPNYRFLPSLGDEIDNQPVVNSEALGVVNPQSQSSRIDETDQNRTTTTNGADILPESSALERTLTGSTDVVMEDVRPENTSQSRPTTGGADSDKENSQPNVSFNTISSFQATDEIGDHSNTNHDSTGPSTESVDELEAGQQNGSGLSVLQNVKQAKTIPNASTEPIVITDEEPERQFGLGITQSPSRRRRTSSYATELRGEEPESVIASSQPVSKNEVTMAAKKAASRGNKLSLGESVGNPAVAAKKDDTQIETADVAPRPAKRKSNTNLSKVASSQQSTVPPPEESSSPELQRKTSVVRILPPGMTEVEYNRIRDSYPNTPASHKKKKQMKPETEAHPQTPANQSNPKGQPSSVEEISSKQDQAAASGNDDVAGDEAPMADHVKANNNITSEQQGEGLEKNELGRSNTKKGKVPTTIPDMTSSQPEQEKEDQHTSKSPKVNVTKPNRTIPATPETDKSISKKSEKLKEMSTPTASLEQSGKTSSSTDHVAVMDPSSSSQKKAKKSKVTSEAGVSKKPAVAVVVSSENTKSKVNKKKDSTPETSHPIAKMAVAKPAIATKASEKSSIKPPPSSAPSLSKSTTPSSLPRPTKAQTITLSTLKQNQAAELRAREEREKQMRKQAAAAQRDRMSTSSRQTKIFSLSDSSSDSDSDSSDSSDSDAVVMPKKNADPATTKPLNQKASSTKTVDGPTKKAPLPPSKSTKGDSFPVSTKNSAPKSAVDDSSDEETSSDASTSSSGSSTSSKSGHPQQANGSAMQMPPPPPSSNNKTADPMELDSDDTDIVKIDKTPPHSLAPTRKLSNASLGKSQQQASSSSMGKGWSFGRLTNSMFNKS